MKSFSLYGALAVGLLVGSLAPAAPAFTDVGSNLTALAWGSVEWGDYDNDGDLDLLTTGLDPSFTARTLLYRNDGNGVFTKVPTSLPGAAYSRAVWGDYDNDGDLDVLIGGSTADGVYRNDGSNVFTPVASFPGTSWGVVAWGDFDNDGDLDPLVVGGVGTAPVVYHNDRSAFTNAFTYPGYLNNYATASVADFNGDGWLDFLLSPIADGGYRTQLIRNVGDGTFVNHGILLPGVLGGAAPWGDYDNDGNLDVLLVGSGFAIPYRNNGMGGFESTGNLIGNLERTAAAWGDYDNDGRLDVWISGLELNHTPVTRLYRNAGDGFNDSGAVLAGLDFGAIAWGDYDNDGDLDAACIGLAVGTFAPSAHLYRNDGINTNAVPTAPAGLLAAVTNDNVMLSWQAASDANQTGGLSYNVRVGTAPGGSDVVGAMADPAKGWRRVAQRGNASQRLTAAFYNLVPGRNYYWSVQAIDHAFAGSPFAAEDSFYVQAPPAISTMADQMIRFSTSTPALPFTIVDLETPAQELALTAWSSNTNLVAPDGIALGGSGSNRTVTVTPVPLRVGLSLITLVVTDRGGRAATNSFQLSVTNLSPILSHPPNIRLRPGTPLPPVAFVIGDAESPPAELTVTFTFSNTNLIQNYDSTGTGSNRLLHLNLRPDGHGISIVTVVVRDPVGAAATNAFTVEVAEFDGQATGLPNVQLGTVEWGDFDNDGDLDVLIVGSLPGVGNISRVYRNNGGHGFSDINAGLPGGVEVAAWGDYDNDSDLDILLLGGGNVKRIYRNNGDGTFTPAGDLAGGRLLCGGWVDFDNDGALDVFISSSTGTRFHHNNGNGTFTLVGMVLPVSYDGAVAWADFDNDGDLDLALSGVSAAQKPAPRTVIFRNQGNGLFTEIEAGLQGVTQGSLAWGDYDQDGWLDLLLTGINGNYYFTRLYHNHGDGTFSVVATNLPDIHVSAAVWGDYDNDGDLDIFLTGLGIQGVGITARVYRNQGHGLFTDLAEPLTGTYWSAAAWGDSDRDGDLDILYCGTTNGLSSGSGTFLYLNSATLSNSPPTAPTGLVLLPNQVLAWDAGSDRETTNAGGLTYDLRIGTTPGGVEVMSPPAALPTGARRVAAFGNAGPARRWRADLPPGTYYWSVQTIDAAFAGSSFSAESSFIVTNLHPRVLAPTNYLMSLNRTSAPLAVTVGDAETPATDLVLTGTSSNTNLVPNHGLFFGGSASNRTLTVVPGLNQTGITLITLTVTDAGGLSASSSFVLAVTNYPPTISSIPNQSTAAGQTMPPIFFTVGDAETLGSDLTVSGTSSHTNLVPNANIVFGGSGSNRTATITPASPAPGQSTITITVSDPDGATASRSFVVSFDLFTVAATNLIPATRGSVAWGDFDNDDDLDLILVGQNTSILDAQAVLYRNEDGVFVAALTNAQNWVDASVAWGDFNNDGRLDYAVSGRNTGVRLYPNNGNGTGGGFSVGALIHSGSLAWGDADGDGDLDLLATGGTGVFTAYASAIYLNEDFWPGYGTPFTAVRQGSGTWADFDKDGDPDVLLTGLPLGTTNGLTRLYRNEGHLTFTDTGLRLPGLYNSAAAWADFNNDGWLDFVLCGFTGTNNLTRVYLNRQDGTFAESDAGLPAVEYGAVACGDVDNDGFSDIFLCGLTNATAAASAITRLYHNNHDGTFTDLELGLPGVYAGGLALGDFDNDGDLDLALCGSNTTTFFSRVFRNNVSVANTPPLSPAGPLTAIASNGIVTFSWQPATDSQTTNGLTYNLRVGRTPGGDDAVSGQAAAHGARRLPALGNVGTALQRTLTLPPGTYYWSVQSVDAALAGSPFAAEASVILKSGVQLSISPPRAGQFEVRLSGEPYEHYRIELSEDLVHWDLLDIRQASPTGSLGLTNNLGGSQRFFRARVAP